MKKLLAIPLLASFALATPTVERLKWDNFGSDPDSVTGIALKGAYSGAGLGVLRMNAGSTAMELATPTGTGAPVNDSSPTIRGNTTLTGPATLQSTLAVTGTNRTPSSYVYGLRGIFGTEVDEGFALQVFGTAKIQGTDFTVNSPMTQIGGYGFATSGTLSVTGNVTVNTDKFTVNASTGKAVSADTVAAVGLRAGRLNIGGATLNFSDSVALVKIYRETQGAGSGTHTYGIDVNVKADAGDDFVNSTGIRINLPGGSLPDSAIGIRIDSVAGAANVRYAIMSTSTAPSLLHGSLGVMENIISEDTVRGVYVTGSYRSSVFTVSTDADFSVEPDHDMYVYAPEVTITQNRRVVLNNPANYGLGYCVQFVRANDAQTTYTWSVDPQSWPINGSTDDIPIGTYGTLKVCTAIKASTGLVEEWVIVAQNPAP